MKLSSAIVGEQAGPLEHEIEIRVRYQETDGQGRVHHANYLTWFELGRVELLRAAGHSYRELEAAGLFLVVLLALVAVACSGAGADPSRTRPPEAGPTTTSTARTAGGVDLVSVRTAFCHDYLPLLGVVLDVDTVTYGDAIGPGNEDDVVAMIEVDRGVLGQTRTRMKIYADSFGALGEEDASATARETARLVGDIINASDGPAVAVALGPQGLDTVLPSAYCEPVISKDFGRGYFDGWLLRPKATDTSEYLHGYRTGRDEGWRTEGLTR